MSSSNKRKHYFHCLDHKILIWSQFVAFTRNLALVNQSCLHYMCILRQHVKDVQIAVFLQCESDFLHGSEYGYT